MRNKDMSLLKMSNLTESLSKKYRLNESYSTNGITLDKMKSDIQKAKNRLKKQKPRENFGQNEIRKIEDKYSSLQLDYYSDYSKLINDFIDWCGTYTFNESYTGANIWSVQNRYDYAVKLGLEKEAREILKNRNITVDKNNKCHELPTSACTGAYSDLVQLTKNTKTVNEDYGEDKYSLVGQDGNAFALMGYTSRCMKECGLRDEVDEMIDRATESNYDNLIMVCDEYVQRCNDIARNGFEESLNEDYDLPIDHSGEFAGWIAQYQGKKIEIDKSEADGIYEAKLLAIKKLKVPKSKEGLLSIQPGYNY